MITITDLYSPDEINNILKLVTELFMLIFATSIGTFTREMIYPKEHTFKQNIGFSLIAGFIALAVTVQFEDKLNLAYSFLVCVGIGFFIPVFKGWLKGKKLFKIITKAINKTTSVTSNLLEEVEKELDEEE